MNASADPSAYQWAKFRDYLETVEARKAMMLACVERIYTHCLKCANADNTRKCDSEGFKDWILRDFILSRRKLGETRTDMHRFMAEQVKPAVAYFEQLRSERAPSYSRAVLLPEARQINIPQRRQQTKIFDEILILFKLQGANADIMPRGRLLYIDV